MYTKNNTTQEGFPIITNLQKDIKTTYKLTKPQFSGHQGGSLVSRSRSPVRYLSIKDDKYTVKICNRC